MPARCRCWRARRGSNPATRRSTTISATLIGAPGAPRGALPVAHGGGARARSGRGGTAGEKARFRSRCRDRRSRGDDDAQVIEPAPAKVNLALHLRRRRDDGYHDLETLFAFTDFGDTLAVADGDGLTLTVIGPFADAVGDGDNLVLRAARALAGAAGCPAVAALTLDKRIPVAAGLGGGSADAAAALRLLNRFWRLDWPLGRLAAVADPLGADVPACVFSRTMAGTGRGDALSPVDFSSPGCRCCWSIRAWPCRPARSSPAGTGSTAGRSTFPRGGRHATTSPPRRSARPGHRRCPCRPRGERCRSSSACRGRGRHASRSIATREAAPRRRGRSRGTSGWWRTATALK